MQIQIDLIVSKLLISALIVADVKSQSVVDVLRERSVEEIFEIARTSTTGLKATIEVEESINQQLLELFGGLEADIG